MSGFVGVGHGEEREVDAQARKSRIKKWGAERPVERGEAARGVGVVVDGIGRRTGRTFRTDRTEDRTEIGMGVMGDMRGMGVIGGMSRWDLVGFECACGFSIVNRDS
jgi:hypothetical protein